jgi:transaldolase
VKPTEQLHDLGQSLWLDNITRELLNDGTLAHYIQAFSVTGLTSNPSIFQKAMAQGSAYDADITAASEGTPNEELFISMALADLGRAADLFRPAHENSGGIDGWVSMEVSPLLADDAQGTVEAAKRLHQQGARDNLFIKIPGTPAGVQAIEEATFAGIPINVTLLFSDAQCQAAAGARMRGLERRLEAGLDPRVHSVLSLFVSRWDVAANKYVPDNLKNRLGIAVATQAWRSWREMLYGSRWHKLAIAGAPVQRLLWASTGTKDPGASDVLYVESLAAPDTINSLPEKTLRAFADHGRVDHRMPKNGWDSTRVLADVARAGIDVNALAEELQTEGADAFVKSWRALMDEIKRKRPYKHPHPDRASQS